MLVAQNLYKRSYALVLRRVDMAVLFAQGIFSFEPASGNLI